MEGCCIPISSVAGGDRQLVFDMIVLKESHGKTDGYSSIAIVYAQEHLEANHTGSGGRNRYC